MFYKYRQNNSGGYFKKPAIEVFIEAPDVEAANAIATTKGLYFNGAGDCTCCGDRWHECYEKGSTEAVPSDYELAYYDQRATEEGIARAAIFFSDGSSKFIGGVAK